MADQPGTRASLLMRVRDPGDKEAWREFVDLYAPLVYHFGRKRGLQDADAADLTQIVLQQLAQGMKRENYDPQRGPFHGWFFSVVRNQLLKLLEKRRRYPQAAADTTADEILDNQPSREEEDSALWDQEYQRRMFAWAVDRVKGDFEESSWQAFWQTAVEGKSAKELTTTLKMSVGAIYTAKSRVLDRIKKEIRQLKDEHI